MSDPTLSNATDGFIQHQPPPAILTAVELILGVFGILGNSVVCYVIYRARAMHTLTNCLIVNLAIADLFVCICLVVFSEKFFLALSPQGQVAGSMFCILCVDKNGCWFFTYAAVTSLTLVTLERYTAIVAPFRYPRYFTWGKTACYVFVAWAVAFFVEFPYLFVPKYDLETRSCYYDHLGPGVKIFTAINGGLCTFILPLLIMVFAYWRIIRCLKQRAKELMREGTNSPAQELLGASRKVVKTLMVVTVIFVALWVPIQTCCSLLSIIPSLGRLEVFIKLYGGLRTVGYLNSVLNVIVYSVKYQQFRLAARATLFPSFWNKVAPFSEKNNSGGPNDTKVSHISN